MAATDASMTRVAGAAHGNLERLPLCWEDGTEPTTLADRLTVEALRLALRPPHGDADAVAKLSALAHGDELAVRRALRRIEHGGGREGSISTRAAMYLRGTLAH